MGVVIGFGQRIGQMVRHAAPRAELATVLSERQAQVAIREATRSLDTLALSPAVRLHSSAALERAAQQHLELAKTRAALDVITPERAKLLTSIAEPDCFFEGIKYLSPKQLRTLAADEPRAIDLFTRHATTQQAVWLDRINPLIKPFGVEARGTAKGWDSMVGRLEKESRKLRAAGSTLGAAPIDLHDLNRARIDLPSLDPTQMRTMVTTLQEGLKTRYPERQFQVSVWDRTTAAVLGNPAELYQGRIHLKIKDVTGGLPQTMFELQIGPRQATSLWDAPFRVNGVSRAFNLHDAVYKGVATLSDERMFEKIGRAASPVPLEGLPARSLGHRTVEDTLKTYQNQLDAMIDTAKHGADFDYAATSGLRDQIGVIHRALADEPTLPEGLLGKALS